MRDSAVTFKSLGLCVCVCVESVCLPYVCLEKRECTCESSGKLLKTLSSLLLIYFCKLCLCLQGRVKGQTPRWFIIQYNSRKDVSNLLCHNSRIHGAVPMRFCTFEGIHQILEYNSCRPCNSGILFI